MSRRRIGSAGYAVAVHALLTAWLRDDRAGPDPRHAALLEAARGTCAVLAGEEDPIEDGYALVLAAEVLVDRADEVAVESSGALASLVTWSDLHEVLDEEVDTDPDEGDDEDDEEDDDVD